MGGEPQGREGAVRAVGSSSRWGAYLHLLVFLLLLLPIQLRRMPAPALARLCAAVQRAARPSGAHRCLQRLQPRSEVLALRAKGVRAAASVGRRRSRAVAGKRAARRRRGAGHRAAVHRYRRHLQEAAFGQHSHRCGRFGPGHSQALRGPRAAPRSGADRSAQRPARLRRRPPALRVLIAAVVEGGVRETGHCRVRWAGGGARCGNRGHNVRQRRLAPSAGSTPGGQCRVSTARSECEPVGAACGTDPLCPKRTDEGSCFRSRTICSIRRELDGGRRGTSRTELGCERREIFSRLAARGARRRVEPSAVDRRLKGLSTYTRCPWLPFISTRDRTRPSLSP